MSLSGATNDKPALLCGEPGRKCLAAPGTRRKLWRSHISLFESRSPVAPPIQPFVQAANWCADNKTNLEDGLKWADYGISGPFIGEKNFRTLSAKARILDLMGKTTEAAAIMKEATPLGTMNEVHAYARQLLAAKKVTEAAEVFRANYKKYPNVFTTNMGMMRALSSEGKYTEALKYANAALPQAPDAANKSFVTGIIEKLKEGKDVNQ